MNIRTLIIAGALSACFASAQVTAQNTNPTPTPTAENPFRAGGAADPFAARSAEPGDSATRLIDLQWEAFSLPLTEAHLFLRKFKTDAERYEEIVRRADAGEAKLELLHRLRTRSGQRAKVEAIDEKIYPTEFVEQQPSKTAKDQPKDAPPAEAVTAALLPRAFETRNVGATLEVEATLRDDGATVDVTVAPESIKYLGDDTYQGGTTQPRFEVQKMDTSFTAKAGQAALVGTQSPPNGTGVQGSNEEKVVWFSFMTVEVVLVK